MTTGWIALLILLPERFPVYALPSCPPLSTATGCEVSKPLDAVLTFTLGCPPLGSQPFLCSFTDPNLPEHTETPSAVATSQPHVQAASGGSDGRFT